MRRSTPLNCQFKFISVNRSIFSLFCYQHRFYMYTLFKSDNLIRVSCFHFESFESRRSETIESIVYDDGDDDKEKHQDDNSNRNFSSIYLKTRCGYIEMKLFAIV